MPSGGVLVAFALAAMVWLSGVALWHGVKKVGHGVKVGVSRLVHPHRPTPPDPDGGPADNAPN